jgi:hypothetical protein
MPDGFPNNGPSSSPARLPDLRAGRTGDAKPRLRRAAGRRQPDDPTFPSGVRSVIDDQDLERSFRLNIEAVPTLIRFKDGREVERTVGWERKEWMRLAGAARPAMACPTGSRAAAPKASSPACTRR